MLFDGKSKQRFMAVVVVLFFSWPLYMFIHSTYIKYEIITNHSVGTASIIHKSSSGHDNYDYTYFVDDKIYSGTSPLDHHDKKYLNPNNLNEVPVYYSKDHPDISLLYIPDAVIGNIILFVFIFGGFWLYFFVIIIFPNDIQDQYKTNRRAIAFVILLILSLPLYRNIVSTYKNYKIIFNISVGTATITGKEYWFGYSNTYKYKFTANGIEYTGTSRIDDEDEKSPADIGTGSTVTVYYSENTPSISLLHKPDPALYLFSFIMFIGWMYCLMVIIDTHKFSIKQKIRDSRTLKIRIIAAISLLILFWFLFDLGLFLCSRYEFINNHSVGTATIICKDTEGNSSYRFVVGGKGYTGESSYDETQSAAPAGRTVKVYYYNNNPEFSRLYLPDLTNYLLFYIFIFIVWLTSLVTIIYPSLWLKLVKKRHEDKRQLESRLVDVNQHGVEKTADIIPPDTVQMGELINFRLLIKGRCPFDAPSAKKVFLKIINKIKNSDYYTAIEETKAEKLSLHFKPGPGEFTIKWPFISSNSVGIKFNQSLASALGKNGFTVEKCVLNKINVQDEERKRFQIKITGKHTIDDMSIAANAIINAAVEIFDKNQYGFDDQEWRNISLSTSSNNSFILKWPIICTNSAIVKFKLDLVDNLIKHGFIIKKSKITVKKEIKPFWKLWRYF